MSLIGSGASALWFTKEAADAVCAYFGVGRMDYPPNRVEQGGWLVGVYEDDRPHRTQGVVTHFLPATGCTGAPAYLNWPATENIRLQRRFFDLKGELEAQSPGLAGRLRRLGWIHSHPNNLPVFLSGTDKANIREHFNDPSKFSVVLNPHTREWKAYLGLNDRDPIPMAVLTAMEEYAVRAEATGQEQVPQSEQQLPAKQKKKPYRKAVYGKAPGGKRRKRGRKKGR